MSTETQPREYPEHQKLKAIKDKSQTIGEFLEWLTSEQKIVLAKGHEHGETCEDEEGEVNCGQWEGQLYGVQKPITQWLAEYFNIDQRKLDAEKEAMLEELRKAQAPTASGAGKVPGAKSHGGRSSRSAKRSSRERAGRG